MKKIKKRPKKREGLIINKTYSKDVDNVLKDFENVIKPELKNMEYFYYNANTIEFETVKSDDLLYDYSLAEYNAYENKIRYIKKDFKYSIMHELLHLASRVRTRKTLYIGFHQIDLNTNESIGFGLNEAYTCILDERYFKDYVEDKMHYLKDTYAISRELISLLEDIVTKEVMEKFYFDADLYNFVKYLNQYMSYDEIIKFIKAIDNIHIYCDNAQIPNVFIARKEYTYALRFIGQCYLNVICELYYNKLIYKETFTYFQEKIKNIMNRKLCFKGAEFLKTRGISEKNFKECLKQAKIKTLKKYT